MKSLSQLATYCHGDDLLLHSRVAPSEGSQRGWWTKSKRYVLKSIKTPIKIFVIVKFIKLSIVVDCALAGKLLLKNDFELANVQA